MELSYLVTGLRATERRDAEAIFSLPDWGIATSLTLALPIFPCHQIAIGLAIAMVE